MFRCEGCSEKYNKKRKPTKGNTDFNVTQFKVTTVQRKVKYINQIRFEKPNSKPSYKIIGQYFGFETVEEKTYCQYHIPKDFKPKVLDKIVERVTTVKVKRPHRGEN